ncbi:MAG: carbohydrate kinase [Tannerellaceae bacterium]|jgi:fructokinase|nr:carbohydrate kinase [Tannerellaceae bacterium]
MRKVIGVGETILDIVFKNNRPKAALPGGSVFNAFVSLGRMNVPLCFIGEVGNDRVGDIILAFMESNNIPTGSISRFPNSKTPLSIAFLNEQNEADYLFYKDYPNQRLDTVLPEINEDDIFVFGSYYALNPVLRERITELLNHARSRNAIIYYDPNFRDAHAHETVKLRPAMLENFEYADIIRGSDEDFRNIFKETDMSRVFSEHIKYYCPRLIITGGGSSAVKLYAGSHCREYPVRQIQPQSTIGAGDNFNAGIIYGLLRYEVRRSELADMPLDKWTKLINCAIDFATEACTGSDNYISTQFASQYIARPL